MPLIYMMGHMGHETCAVQKSARRFEYPASFLWSEDIITQATSC